MKWSSPQKHTWDRAPSEHPSISNGLLPTAQCSVTVLLQVPCQRTPNLMWGTRWINSTLCSGMCVVIKVFLNADVQYRLVCSSAFLSVRCGNGWSSVSPPYPLGHSGTNICFASVLEDKYSMGHRITICTSWTVPHPVLLTIAVCLLLDITWVGLVLLLLFCFSLCRRAKV